MKDPTGKSAPAGGFQQGGWYSGYQYYNGSFAPQAGMIHSTSPQQGAGQMVSKEVNRQGSVAQGLAPNTNQEYIDRLNAQPVQNPGAVAGGGATGAGMGTGTPGGGAGTGVGVGIAPPATINLPDMYKNLLANSGVSELEKEYSDKEKEFIETKGKINDNPFLSEGTRVGRVAKLEELFAERTANILKDIETKKADVEMQLNLATKQFDIDSQSAQQALDQFNTLLSMGALEGASGTDIANLTRATGLSSSAIYSAINAQKKKDIQTQVITSTDDSGNVTAVVINSNTGEVISKNSLGQIDKATKSEDSSYTPGSSASVSVAISEMTPKITSRLNSYGDISPADWNTALQAWMSAGFSREDFIKNFGQYADTNRGDFQNAYGFENPAY